MTAKERDALVRELRRMRQSILSEVAATESDLELIAESREIELVDKAQDEQTARLLARLDDRGKRELEEVDVALGRIADGSYGACRACGGRIPAARLRALPATAHCLDCARDEEARQRPRALS
jgi:RNA polymerase-binding protein DksA